MIPLTLQMVCHLLIFLLLTQPETSTSTIKNQKIKPLSKSEMTEPIDFEVRTRHHQGTKDINMQETSGDCWIFTAKLALNQFNGNAPISSKETVPSLKNLVILSTYSKPSHPYTILTAMDKVKELAESGSTTISCSCGSTMGLFWGIYKLCFTVRQNAPVDEFLGGGGGGE